VNLLKEVAMYAKATPNLEYEEWFKQYGQRPLIIDQCILPQITVGYDMAWQKRSSGHHRYDSHSGHAVPFGVLSKLLVAVRILNNQFRICSGTSAIEDEEQHNCIANFVGASGAMESAALVHIAHSLLDKEHVLFGIIVADDDSSIRVNMKC
jgi:hypothetical protein